MLKIHPKLIKYIDNYLHNLTIKHGVFFEIFVLFRNNNSNDDTLYPVSSAQCICRISAMTNIVLDIAKSTGKQVRMVTKPRTLELLGHSGTRA